MIENGKGVRFHDFHEFHAEMPVPPSAAPLDLEDAIARFETWMRQNRGRARLTVEKYIQCLRRLSRWLEQPPKDPQLRPAHECLITVDLADLRLFTGLYSHSLGLTPQARRPVVSALKCWFAWMAAEGLRRDDPAVKLESPAAGLRLPRATSLDAATKMLMAPDLSTLRGVRDAAIIGTLIGTGVRLRGLIGMNESALLWDSEEGAERLTIRVCEKGDRERLIPAPPETAMLIRAYLGHPELAQINRQLPDGDRVLWINTTSGGQVKAHDYYGERRRLGTRGIKELLDRHGERAGVPPEQRNPHAFRHLFGTELAESEVGLDVRAALLGHVKVETTRIYDSMAFRRLRRISAAGNPLAKMRSPLMDSLRQLAKATAGPGKSSSGPPADKNRQSAGAPDG